MSKALSLLCLCLAFLICSGGSARADKPKIAVLGLEVAPGLGGTVDPATTQVAKDITRELRTRAQSGSSPYIIAPNSNKELTDEKLLLSCDNEGRDCMAVIGAGLAADVMLYGRVEKKGELYKVTLKLFDVKNKTFESRTDDMPVGGSPVGVSKRLYGKLITDTVTGSSLAIVARSEGSKPVDAGRVMIDDERVGDLAGGKLTLPNVPEGRHTVAIESGGFRRYEGNVTIRNGEPARLDAQLVERTQAGSAPASGSASSRTSFWKISLGTGLGLAAVGGALAYAGYRQQTTYYDNVKNSLMPTTAASPTTSYCGHNVTDINKAFKLTSFDDSAFNDACTWHKVNVVGLVALGVGGVGAVTSLVMVLLESRSSEKTAAAGAGKPSIALTPVLTSDQAGAALSIRW